VRLRLLIEYDGTDYAGWQRQPGDPTIQQTLEEVFERLLGIPISLIAAGRTDAGVHASGQVAHFDVETLRVPLDRLTIAANSFLPPAIRVLAAEPAAPDFHARYSATSRSYHYRIEHTLHPLRSRTSWTPMLPWDDTLAEEGVSLLFGRHDFRAFALYRPGELHYECVVTEAHWVADNDGVTFRITANRFLHKMVRGLVGSLFDLARGYYSPDDFRQLLERPVRCGAVRIAPAKGLTLVAVAYPDKQISSTD